MASRGLCACKRCIENSGPKTRKAGREADAPEAPRTQRAQSSVEGHGRGRLTSGFLAARAAVLARGHGVFAGAVCGARYVVGVVSAVDDRVVIRRFVNRASNGGR